MSSVEPSALSAVQVAGAYRRRTEVLEEIAFVIDTDDFSSLVRRLQRYGGRSLGYLGYDCPHPPEREGANTLWSGCALRRVRAAGDTLRTAAHAEGLRLLATAWTEAYQARFEGPALESGADQRTAMELAAQLGGDFLPLGTPRCWASTAASKSWRGPSISSSASRTSSRRPAC